MGDFPGGDTHEHNEQDWVLVMPAANLTQRRRRTQCACGCGQAPASSTRLRKAECPWCGYIVRLSRDCIARGLPVCPCGAACEPTCLHDAVLAPGTVGDRAFSELCARDDEFARRSEQMRKRAPQHRCPGCQAFRPAGAGADPTRPDPCPSCGSLERAIRPPRKIAAQVAAMPF